MLLGDTYPTPAMSAVPTVLLEAFLASEALDDDDDRPEMSDVGQQRRYCTYEGALVRARSCGGLKSHDQQAAALLSAIREIDMLLDGSMTVGGELALRHKLDHDELGAVQTCRDTMVNLLHWHFANGAGALLPLARSLGLVVKRRA